MREIVGSDAGPEGEGDDFDNVESEIDGISSDAGPEGDGDDFGDMESEIEGGDDGLENEGKLNELDDNEWSPSVSTIQESALLFLDQKYITSQSESNISASLKLFKHIMIRQNADPKLIEAIPNDFQHMKTVLRFINIPFTKIDSCIHDHFLFRGSHSNSTTCPVKVEDVDKKVRICGEPRFKARSSVARRSAYYCDIEEWLRQVHRIPPLVALLLFTEEARRLGANGDELGDFFTGDIYQGVRSDLMARGIDPMKGHFFSMTHDEVEVSRWPQQNMLPVLCQYLNAPSWIRGRLYMMVLCAVFPKNCKNAQLFMEPIAEMFSRLGPEGAGLSLPSVGSEQFCMLIGDGNDFRGLHKGSCQAQTGAIKFACSDCEQEGLHCACYGARVYPGAVRFLLQVSALSITPSIHNRQPFLNHCPF